MNQCDGCQAGIPVDKNGHHRMGGMVRPDGTPSTYPNLQACTKDRYAPLTSVDIPDRSTAMTETQKQAAAALIGSLVVVCLSLLGYGIGHSFDPRMPAILAVIVGILVEGGVVALGTIFLTLAMVIGEKVLRVLGVPFKWDGP